MGLEIEIGTTRSHGLENSLWKRLRTCLKTVYSMVVMVVIVAMVVMICKNKEKSSKIHLQ
jgi:hypothetical protein